MIEKPKNLSSSPLAILCFRVSSSQLSVSLSFSRFEGCFEWQRGWVSWVSEGEKICVGRNTLEGREKGDSGGCSVLRFSHCSLVFSLLSFELVLAWVMSKKRRRDGDYRGRNWRRVDDKDK